MLVMKIDKELSTKECIEYGKQLSEHIGEKVIILDKKVLSFERLDKQKIFIPIDSTPLIDRMEPFTPNDYWYWTTCTNETATSIK